MTKENERTLSVAMIGLGGVAQAHLQAFDMLDTVRLSAVCDVREEVAKETAERYGSQAYIDYNALLKECDVDLVMVLTPASTHRMIVEAVAQKGVAVFCEKPMAVTLEDAEAMVACCCNARVPLFYGSCYRYLPALKKARALIQAGAIGEVQLLTEQLIGGHGKAAYQELAPIHYPLGGPGGPGMGLVDHGVHLIDVMPWLMDTHIVSSQGVGHISGDPASTEFMVMQMSNGAVGHLLYNAATYSGGLPNEGMFSGGQGWLADASVAEVGGWESEPGSISVYGSEGMLRIFHYTNALFINKGEGPKQVRLTGRPAFGHFATQLEDVRETIINKREPSVTGDDGMRALSALLEVYA